MKISPLSPSTRIVKVRKRQTPKRDAVGSVRIRIDSLGPRWYIEDDTPLVYRCRDRDGGLLYVGITEKFKSRMRGHSFQSPWWDQVRTVESTFYDSRVDAEIAEAVAIADEHPRHNFSPGTPRALLLLSVGSARWG